ncbi:competence type IV pilus minor pilin ComGE [Lactococcus kimchii]|uniref:competence type IV pilus minor pilin ComGE n=1 Tax=Lactococcus sp. S-13 TaxID=2507158 RepID=UPI001CC1F3DC|nr:competence type IV pilus minor pilin ComGE [Lactococcus sp. S-13]
MENIKNRSIRAYLLLESLITLALLSVLVGTVLTEITRSRTQENIENQQIEALSVARMAVDSQMSSLSLNGATIKVVHSPTKIFISNHGEELLELERED